MCWTGKCDVKTAKNDIVVYKLGFITEGGFLSLYLNYIYASKKINKEVKIKPLICGYNIYKPEKERHCVIYEGYHSYKEITMPYSELYIGFRMVYLGKTADRIGLFNRYYVATFIIPKGSEYYENEDGELVSSNIIYTGKYLKL